MKIKNVLCFLPVLFITILVLYPIATIQFAHTILGKCILLVILFAYTSVDIVYGIFVCLLILLLFYVHPPFGSQESMVGLTTIDDPIIYVDINSKNKDFQHANCSSDGDLIFKGMIIKPEMADHIFPELQFQHGHKCNVCSGTCNFHTESVPEQETTYSNIFGLL